MLLRFIMVLCGKQNKEGLTTLKCKRMNSFQNFFFSEMCNVFLESCHLYSDTPKKDNLPPLNGEHVYIIPPEYRINSVAKASEFY